MEDLVGVTARTLYISTTATILASLWGIPIAYLIASRRLQTLATVFEALVGIPTVLIGLLLYLLLSKQGPLGSLNLLYTPTAIILGEAVLVTPLIVGASHRILKASIDTYGELAASLGASRIQAMALALAESLPGIASSMAMAFSRAVGELGIALLVGGNLKGYTRTLSTSIALEVSMGEYGDAIRLGAVLLSLSLGFSIVARLLGGRG
ncbi:MAG: ABC transporter permease [Desulfurococcales archaeon]|nr:ABC transporter permease [Desulfurococcales archaeon]